MNSFSWLDFLEFAEWIINKCDQDDDAALRSAVSRAYYTAFHSAKSVLNANGIEISDRDSSHKQVWDAFLNGKNLDWKAVGRKGDEIRVKRTDADYKLKKLNWLPEAEKTIEETKKILATLSKIAQQTPIEK